MFNPIALVLGVFGFLSGLLFLQGLLDISFSAPFRHGSGVVFLIMMGVSIKSFLFDMFPEAHQVRL